MLVQSLGMPPSLPQRHPTLTLVTEGVKFELTAAHKQERKDVATQLRTWGMEAVRDLVFYDVATFYVACEQRHRVWVDMMTEWHREQVVFSHTFQQDHPVCLRWHAAVGAKLKEPLIHLATGTTGYDPGHKVSGGCSPSLALKRSGLVGGQRLAKGAREEDKGAAGGEQLLQRRHQGSLKFRLVFVVQPCHRQALRHRCSVECAVPLLLCCHRLAGEGMCLLKMLCAVDLHQQVRQPAASHAAKNNQISCCVPLLPLLAQQPHLRDNAASEASSSQRSLCRPPCSELRL